VIAVPVYADEPVPDEIAEYCQRIGRAMTADRGDVLVREGDSALKSYYVKRGYAKVLAAMPSGQQRLLGFIGPGDVIGLAAAHVALGRPYIATTIATTHMELQMWTREFVLKSAAHHPQLQDMLDTLLSRRIETIMGRIHTVSGGRVPDRVAHILLELGERHGDVTADGITIRPRLTRDDLASMVGTTLSTVSRLLSDWEKQGIVAKAGGRIRLKQVDRLREMAQA
jgi:CRP-like cAMP-binding protein